MKDRASAVIHWVLHLKMCAMDNMAQDYMEKVLLAVQSETDERVKEQEARIRELRQCLGQYYEPTSEESNKWFRNTLVKLNQGIQLTGEDRREFFADTALFNWRNRRGQDRRTSV